MADAAHTEIHFTPSLQSDGSHGLHTQHRLRSWRQWTRPQELQRRSGRPRPPGTSPSAVARHHGHQLKGGMRQKAARQQLAVRFENTRRLI